MRTVWKIVSAPFRLVAWLGRGFLNLVGKAIGQYTDQSNVVLNVPRTARMVPIDGIFQAVGCLFIQTNFFEPENG